MAQKTKQRSLGRYALQTTLAFIACFLFSVITCSVVGAYYPKTLTALHLEWLYVPLRGIYTDCSDYENRNAVYCRPKDSGYDMRRAGIREKRQNSPFTLYKQPGE